MFDHAAKPLLSNFIKKIDVSLIGDGSRYLRETSVDNKKLIDVNEIIRFHPVEIIGYELRDSMTAMKKIV